MGTELYIFCHASTFLLITITKARCLFMLDHGYKYFASVILTVFKYKIIITCRWFTCILKMLWYIMQTDLFTFYI